VSDEAVSEIYTYGEETVVVPTDENDEETGAEKLAREQIEYQLREYVDNPEVEFISDNHIRLLVSEDDIPHIIGQGGENIERIEDELGLDISVEPRGELSKDEIGYSIEERGKSVVIDIGEQLSGEDVDVLRGDEFLFAATVGKEGEISLTKESELASKVLNAHATDKLEVRH
jgi:ATPase